MHSKLIQGNTEMQNEMEEKFENWRGEEAISGKHGGIKAASIACVVEVMENMVFLAYSTNFMMYFTKSMHYPSAQAANMVTNFIGTSFLLTIFGGFVADSFLTRSAAFVIFCSIELLGLILLTLQAHYPKLQPHGDKTPSTLQATILFTGLYTVATGVGGVKGSLPAHGGDQLGSRNQRLISGFFNWYYFSVCFGGLLAVTVMVWIEENKGWSSSFYITTAILASALFIFSVGFPMYRFKRPIGSPLIRMVDVLVSAARNRNRFVTDAEITPSHNSTDKSIHYNKFKFLNKAKLNNKISAIHIEETRTFLALQPIFLSTIVMNCCLAQLATFSVQQGMAMNKKLSRSFEIPVASLNAIPLFCMISSLALYELFGKRILSSNDERSSSFNLKRIGCGLALSSVSMAVAAIVEVIRKHEAVHNNIKISVFWLEIQFVLLTFSDMLTLGGMLEFFYREAPASMRSISTALGWCSTAMGFFLSSVLVDVINAVTGWLRKEDLNESRLELFYVVLCVLNTLNLFNYIFWAKRY
ncbi:Protein NRT1/ PTR FAMILY 4.1 [Cardamine amara subsp. amara]|uniref:Protein NRT1/ PTR FAMILY 4.1 n=1 Tax=Cardamine amara subsp. amara TaxID=228776 RepID=A0ABD0ZUG5_CARAN